MRRLVFRSFALAATRKLALRGEHPKFIQAVMRSRATTRTMDACGHKFSDQESAAIDRSEGIMIHPPIGLTAIGTADTLPR
jgi:hypothetical protein